MVDVLVQSSITSCNYETRSQHGITPERHVYLLPNLSIAIVMITYTTSARFQFLFPILPSRALGFRELVQTDAVVQQIRSKTTETAV